MCTERFVGRRRPRENTENICALGTRLKTRNVSVLDSERHKEHKKLSGRRRKVAEVLKQNYGSLHGITLPVFLNNEK